MLPIFEEGPPVRMLEFEGNASLVGRVGPPVEALVRRGIIAVERPEPAGGTADGWLDLQYVGSKVAQDLAAQEPSLVRQVQHPIGRQQFRFPGLFHPASYYRRFTSGYSMPAGPFVKEEDAVWSGRAS